MSLQICVMSWLAHFSPVLKIPISVKYVCCVRARDVRIDPKIIDGQPIQMMSECRVRLGNFGRSFISSEMYKSALTRIIVISWSVLRALRHFCNASTDAVHVPRIPS